jgi:hypothetical protein
MCLTNYALCHEGVWGSGCRDPRFLNLGTSWRCVVSLTSLPLSPRGKSPWYPLEERMGGPESWSGRYGEVEILDPTRTPNGPLSGPTHSQSLSDYTTAHYSTLLYIFTISFQSIDNRSRTIEAVTVHVFVSFVDSCLKSQVSFILLQMKLWIYFPLRQNNIYARHELDRVLIRTTLEPQGNSVYIYLFLWDRPTYVNICCFMPDVH